MAGNVSEDAVTDQAVAAEGGVSAGQAQGRGGDGDRAGGDGVSGVGDGRMKLATNTVAARVGSQGNIEGNTNG